MTESYPDYKLAMTVTWGDCDAAGISYYARTFDWFTNARMGFLASFGFPYMEAFHHEGISMVCLTADCAYQKMLRPDEQITVHVSLAEFTRARLTFAYRVMKKNGQLAAEGKTTHTYVDKDGNPFNLKKRHPVLWERLTDKWPVFND